MQYFHVWFLLLDQLLVLDWFDRFNFLLIFQLIQVKLKRRITRDKHIVLLVKELLVAQYLGQFVLVFVFGHDGALEKC